MDLMQIQPSQGASEIYIVKVQKPLTSLSPSQMQKTSGSEHKNRQSIFTKSYKKDNQIEKLKSDGITQIMPIDFNESNLKGSNEPIDQSQLNCNNSQKLLQPLRLSSQLNQYNHSTEIDQKHKINVTRMDQSLQELENKYVNKEEKIYDGQILQKHQNANDQKNRWQQLKELNNPIEKLRQYQINKQKQLLSANNNSLSQNSERFQPLDLTNNSNTIDYQYNPDYLSDSHPPFNEDQLSIAEIQLDSIPPVRVISSRSSIASNQSLKTNNFKSFKTKDGRPYWPDNYLDELSLSKDFYYTQLPSQLQNSLNLRIYPKVVQYAIGKRSLSRDTGMKSDRNILSASARLGGQQINMENSHTQRSSNSSQSVRSSISYPLKAHSPPFLNIHGEVINDSHSEIISKPQFIQPSKQNPNIQTQPSNQIRKKKISISYNKSTPKKKKRISLMSKKFIPENNPQKSYLSAIEALKLNYIQNNLGQQSKRDIRKIDPWLSRKQQLFHKSLYLSPSTPIIRGQIPQMMNSKQNIQQKLIPIGGMRSHSNSIKRIKSTPNVGKQELLQSPHRYKKYNYSNTFNSQDLNIDYYKDVLQIVDKYHQDHSVKNTFPNGPIQKNPNQKDNKFIIIHNAETLNK